MNRQQEQQVFTRNQLVSSLLRLKHAPKGDERSRTKRDNVSKLAVYQSEAIAASKTDADLFAHLIAWNAANGKIRDSKVAFPVLALRGITAQTPEFAENAIAHLLQLSPRELKRAYQFNHYLTFSQVVTSKGTLDLNGVQLEDWVKVDGQRVRQFPLGISANSRKMLQRGLRLYLEHRESNTKLFDRAVLHHRGSMKYLYKVARKTPSAYAQRVLFDGVFANNSVFAKVAALSATPPKEAAGIILEYELPFEVIVGAFPRIKQERDVVLAMIERMTGNQIIDHTEMLQKLGAFADPVLKSAYDAAIVRARTDKRVETLKAGKAADRQAVHGGPRSTAGALSGLQEQRLSQLNRIRGSWAVLGDYSSSMSLAIDMARKVASVIAQGVDESVYLIFFNNSPRFIEVTGLDYQGILQKTRSLVANGGTSIGSALDYLLARKLWVDGIVIVSDGGEWNPPMFAETYQAYCKLMGVEPTVYLLHVPGSDPDNLSVNCARAGVRIEKIIMENADDYALPNVLSVLNANRYQLFDDIMATPLLTIESVFADKGKGATA